MKVKARTLAKNRAKNKKDAWYGIRKMREDEARRAQNVIRSVLLNQPNGLHYGDAPSPIEAILRKYDRRGSFGDRTRQLLIFQSVMNELRKLGAITYDPVRQRVGYNTKSLVR